MRLLIKFYKVLKNDGLITAIKAVHSHFNYLLGIKDFLTKRRMKLSKEINVLLDYTVRYGPFKGLQMARNCWWGASNNASMLLGIYEEEILSSLTNVPKTHRTFIDLGAADGYYGIGVLVNNLFDYSYLFEISKEGRKTIESAARLNHVEHKMVIYGSANKDFYKNIPAELLSTSVLFVDIEGAEFELFDLEIFRVFKDSIVFIELHEWFFENGQEKLLKLKNEAEVFFDITELTTGSRDLSKFDELKNYSDNDRWLICSEGRGKLMKWYRLDPRNKG